jgi:hypothetical protein
VLHKGPSIPTKDQKVGFLALRIKKFPIISPKGCMVAWRYPAKTGSSNYLTEAASIPTSPMLIKRIIAKRSATVVL